MKKFTFLFFVPVLALSFSGCKKCFRCQNECVQCVYTDSLQTLTHVFCRDSFNTQSHFETAISADTALGFVCTSSASTYTYDFCANNAGKESYPDYFNKGNKAPCNEK